MLLFNRTLRAASKASLHIHIHPRPTYLVSRIDKMLLNQCYFGSTKLTKQEIENSSYEDLVAKISKLYSYQEYKIPSALSLLEIQHQYRILKPGDFILDIGAGPNYSWTDLALKLTYNANGSNKVISNDIHNCSKLRQNQIHVTGNFTEEPIQTKIAMHLQQRQLDVILIDATPQFSGIQRKDAIYTMNVFVEALKFSQFYLKKGGTIVFKTIESAQTLQNENQAKFFFNEVYRYKTSSNRITSPCFYYVLKGFMMTDNLKGLDSFLKQYEKSKTSYAKMQIVQKYRQKYQWDPVQLLNNKAKQNIQKLRKEGRQAKQILKVYENDPFVKAKEIIELMNKIEDKATSNIGRLKAQNKLDGISDQQVDNLPETEEQFTEMIFKQAEEMEKLAEREEIERQNKRNKRRGIKKQIPLDEKIDEKAPLGDSELYMKSSKVSEAKKNMNEDSEGNNYRIQDLYGYNPNNPFESIDKVKRNTSQQQKEQEMKELSKIIQSFPEVKQALQKNKEKSRSFQDELRKKQEQFSKIFTGQALPEGKKNKKDYFDEEEDQEEQEPSDFQKQFSQMPQFQRKNNKPQMSSKFDFHGDHEEEKTRKYYKKLQEQAHSQNQQEEYDRLGKVQQIQTKPKKSSHPINYKKNRQQGGSYFKNKAKNKSKNRNF